MTDEVKKVADFFRDSMCQECVHWSQVDAKCFYSHPCIKKHFANVFLQVIDELEKMEQERVRERSKSK